MCPQPIWTTLHTGDGAGEVEVLGKTNEITNLGWAGGDENTSYRKEEVQPLVKLTPSISEYRGRSEGG